jgi:uncharacterized membrane protein
MLRLLPTLPAVTLTLTLACAVPASAPASPPAADVGAATLVAPVSNAALQARLGGRGFGARRPLPGGRRGYGYGYPRRPSYRRPGSGFLGNVLKGLGIAYLVHMLFGWGAGGGSPWPLILIVLAFAWMVTRSRRRRRDRYAGYGY